MGERRGTKALEIWCKRMTEGYVNVKIDNMTTSWKNGLAFCAMVHHFRPDLIDFDKLNKNDIYYNNDLAFRTAEQYLGIPALLDADDMASYEVPDRLSILTYLSQFYQVFASQDSPNRLKRNSSLSVETTVSKSAGPPTKMAHIVGVPKREPCQNCALPVFLAERQVIGKSVYHRTCLKCARCKTQLTPGSFYETEIDGEFCCETCPDEEQSETLAEETEMHKTSKLNNSLANASDTKNVRSSIADRLAFFEMNSGGDGQRLLQKSLSDEEKTQSLKKITEFKPNTALMKFMNSTLNDNKESEESTDDSVYIEVADTNCDPVMSPTKTSPDSEQEQAEEIAQISLPSVEYKSNIMLNIRESIDKEDPDPISSLKKIPLIITQNNNNNYPNVSVNVTKENESNSKKKQQVHTIQRSELIIQQLSDSEREKNINTVDTTDDLQQQSASSDDLHQFDVSNIQESESNLKEINNTIINLNDKSKQIVDSQNIVINKEEEELSHCTDSEEHDSFILVNNINVDNTSYQQENPITHLSNANMKASSENAKMIITSNPTGAIEDSQEKMNHEEIKVLEEDQEIMNTICQVSDITEIQKDTVFEEGNEKEISVNINSVKNTEPIEHTEEGSILLRKLSCEYPEELNPFQSDDNTDEESDFKEKIKSLNPFGSDEDDVNDEELTSDNKIKPARPPPPKITKNPFGSASDNDDEDENLNISKKLSSNLSKKLPIPTPRTQISPLKKETSETHNYLYNSEDFYGSSASLNAANNSGNREIFHRHHEVRNSNTSLTSSTNGKSSRKSKKAPAPPPPISQLQNITKELFPPNAADSMKSSPNSSGSTTPQQIRKKRLAPKPPSLPIIRISDENALASVPTKVESEIPHSSVDIKELKSEIGKLSDEEKAAQLKEKSCYLTTDTSESETESNGGEILEIRRKKLIPLDKSLLEDTNLINDINLKEEHNVVYRRSIRPPIDITSPTKNNSGELIVSFPISLDSPTHDRQLEKMKDNKEAKNRNRQSQCSDDSDPLLNKSTHGKWKRRKGPAPSLPVPPRKVLQMLPLQEIRHELEIIEVQQQGLEKQGVILETMIRERCESKNGKLNNTPINSDLTDLPPVQNSKEVEDLILQLFELVNEKNDLFRRQAELMYLRRQHRLEQEQADLEYEIRVLMAQPERNKTDTDKAREEALIARLVEVVQLRNEVIECLDMDRLREAEEDLSIKQRLELHTAKRDEQLSKETPTKLSKKEKKKQKESKKLGKTKNMDADKDDDESEVNAQNQKDKKKKKKFLF